MGPPTYERYNAKARGSVVSGSSHKKRKRHLLVDEEEIQVKSDQRKALLFSTNTEIDNKPMSSKKKKRLDSYIEKKLKAEERVQTLQLLASLAPSTSASAALLSSSSLGQNPIAPSSAKERAEKREDRLVRRGIDRLKSRTNRLGDSESSEDEVEKGRKGKEKIVEVVLDGHDENAGEVKVTSLSKTQEKTSRANGKKRKGKKSKQASWNPQLMSTQPDSSSDFDSSDSEEDPKEEKVPSLKPPTEPSTAEVNAIGGALKKGANGAMLQPKVLIRSKPAWTFKQRQQRHESKGSDDDDDDDDDISDTSDEDESEELPEEASGSDAGSESGQGNSEAEGNSDGNEEDQGQDQNLLPEVQLCDSGLIRKRSPRRERATGFKDWAQRQMGIHQGPEEPEQPMEEVFPKAPASHTSTTVPNDRHFVGPLGAHLEVPSSSLLTTSNGLESRSAGSSTIRPRINRRPSVSQARMELPILAEEQTIVEAILMHSVVIIAGETGSGKTTQVPQMLYEAGFGFQGSDNPGMIAITQPRRVAAVSLAQRVKSELNLPSSSTVVAHQIRYSSTTSPDTAIKFMTDGVLLRELSTDFLLSRYSAVVVDEAHERGVNTDVLIGVLSRVSKLREKMWREQPDRGVKPLRIVIMSATLRMDDFAKNSTLFAIPPPVIHITARQHPVTVHFSRRTLGDYVSEAYKKIRKIHARLPPGGILVFMTGQAEIQTLCRKLEKDYNRGKGSGKSIDSFTRAKNIVPSVDERETEDVELGGDDDLAADVDDGQAESDPEGLDTDDDESPDIDLEETSAPMHILPLYSLLPNEQQMRVFTSPPEGSRLVIIATNVAETSLTIPGIRYVVDTGRAKERQYDPISNVQRYSVSWISKASAQQRTGRAGRTGPGHCYRLYSSALYEDHFDSFTPPEILRMPIEGVVLQMKSMNIDNVVNFPFPTPPDRLALRKAEDLLINLGALSSPTMGKMINGVSQLGQVGGSITDLGRIMAGFPVSPRFAKMLAIGGQHDCLPYIVAIVAGMSVGDPFVHENSLEMSLDEEDEEDEEIPEMKHITNEEMRAKEERKALRRRYWKSQSQFLGLGNGTSDAFKLLAAVGAYEHEPTSSFCSRNFLRLKAMQEIHQLRNQISSLASLPPSRLITPSDTQLKIIRQILLSSFLDHIAIRTDIITNAPKTFTSCRNVSFRTIGQDEVYVHPSSVLFHKAPPEWVIYSELVQSQSSGRAIMRGLTRVHPAWISQLAPAMCSWSKPQEIKLGASGIRNWSKPQEMKLGAARMGNVGKGDEREVWVIPHFRALGVDLPPVKKIQRREGTRWVLVE
ncbi:hypothetical protein TREMEDRAFT_70724 [Tremella mesenterica DSM 1558]|uniref:uncharacterized protein n=1 Tax=Tremella mesenterica (strain ATCC 24925 / CBS 8224 / DSM 1558 / NBRC 9311 / NRRL Y-6157 / RJB 2259-6 / UBC 559-6) TaxID=578456 RepID=UPI0003F4A222|nr:uncharacterized protein TREMEDRAFT_70724 [Tremella mesenterica DSM 1558]EIW72461.1 hypothetical protein TREMEDRAFT_70724 [Tremella mesenterica DSM 1558]